MFLYAVGSKMLINVHSFAFKTNGQKWAWDAVNIINDKAEFPNVKTIFDHWNEKLWAYICSTIPSRVADNGTSNLVKSKSYDFYKDILY